MYYCHRVSTQLQLTNISYTISYIISYHITYIISYHIYMYHIVSYYIHRIVYRTIYVVYHISYINIYIYTYIYISLVTYVETIIAWMFFDSVTANPRRHVNEICGLKKIMAYMRYGLWLVQPRGFFLPAITFHWGFVLLLVGRKLKSLYTHAHTSAALMSCWACWQLWIP